VDIDGTGGGVVVLRVPPSRRRPHRQMVNKEVFIRRGDETARRRDLACGKFKN
jgi:hypothetical protein